MSKITYEGLTRSGTGCFIAVPIWQQYGFKGLYGARISFMIAWNTAHSRQVQTSQEARLHQYTLWGYGIHLAFVWSRELTLNL